MPAIHGPRTAHGTAYINRATMLGVLLRLGLIKEMTLRLAAVNNYDIYKRALEGESKEAQTTSHTTIDRVAHPNSVSYNEDD
jgi:hypothetical protein